jgi:hypothetical protein
MRGVILSEIIQLVLGVAIIFVRLPHCSRACRMARSLGDALVGGTLTHAGGKHSHGDGKLGGAATSATAGGAQRFG